MRDKSVILGIKYGGHDTSATLIINNKVVAACEQERFDLEKHSRAFPHQAIEELFQEKQIRLDITMILLQILKSKRQASMRYMYRRLIPEQPQQVMLKPPSLRVEF